MPCCFVAEGYRIPDRFELASGDVEIAVTDPRGNYLDDNLTGPGFGLSASTMANGFRGPASLATLIFFVDKRSTSGEIRFSNGRDCLSMIKLQAKAR